MSLEELDQQLIDLQLHYADKLIPLLSGLTQDDIEAIVDAKGGYRLGEGAFGEATPVSYKGKNYLRKTMRFWGGVFSRETFDKEVRLMKLLVANPRTRPYVPFFYGSTVRSIGPKEFGYIVMELLPGMTLENLMTQRFFVKEEYDALMEQINTMLTVFHDEGFLHKDLHGQNIFVRMNGNTIVDPVLIDFGLSSLAKRKRNYKKNENILKNTRFGNRTTLRNRLRNPYERGFRTNRSQLANYSAERLPFKPRNLETMSLMEEQKASLLPLEEAIAAKRAERDALATATNADRKRRWIDSLLNFNTASRNRSQANLSQGLDLKSRLKPYDTTGTVVPQAEELVMRTTLQAFEILRSNGVVLEAAKERAKDIRNELQTVILTKVLSDRDPSVSLEEAFAASKSMFEAKAAELLESARNTTTPTSFYGGRKRTRKRSKH